jgi:hypothetical protein
MSYPEVITAEILKSQEHITDAEIENDLIDTLREIELKKREIVGYENLDFALYGRQEWKMNHLRLNVARDSLKQMEEFCTFLRRLQTARIARA